MRGTTTDLRRRCVALILVSGLAVCLPSAGYGQQRPLVSSVPAPVSTSADDGASKTPHWQFSYGTDGVEIENAASTFRLAVGGRLQLRHSRPFAADPVAPDDLGQSRETVTEIRRARLRLVGHVLSPALTFAVQYDPLENFLLDARINYAIRPWLQLRAGQWSIEYNRERIISSADQQMVDRSILNRTFMLDRQQGAMVHGRVGRGRRWDSNYWTGVFNGTGRGRGNDDGRPMWMARYQWNAAGGGLDFTAGDLDRGKDVRAAFAVAASGNRSAYSRFAIGGADQLEGVLPGLPGQYGVGQWVAESALRWRGTSLQHEYHWKRVTDRRTGETRRIDGFYVQGGFFPHEFWKPAPRPLEIAARYAAIDADRTGIEHPRQEIGVGANWFLRRHRHKLEADATRLRFDTPQGSTTSPVRIRLQWEISF